MTIEQLEEYILDIRKDIYDAISALADRTNYFRNQIQDILLQIRYTQAVVIAIIFVFTAAIIHLHKKNKKLEYEIAKIKDRMNDK